MAVKDKGSALEGFFALYDGTGNSETTIRETVTTKCVLEFDQVQLVHNHGGKPYRGTPLGRLPDLWPFDLLKTPLLEHALGRDALGQSRLTVARAVVVGEEAL